MVRQTQVLSYFVGSRNKLINKTGFIDTLRVYVKGGGGGQGFPRLGGVGGAGGSVILEADKQQNLKQLKQKYPTKRFIAGNGKNSTKRVIIARNGSELKVKVPIGISVESDHGRLIGELNETGQQLLVAHGGVGGSLNNKFLGQQGEIRTLKLVMKLIADVGFVGFPNAGKSTLLRALSKAKPTVAPLPFTTLRPEIGMIEFSDHRQIKLADLPGLIEGAHLNLGMGHKFLRHVERTKLLLFVVDVRGFRLQMEKEERSAFETILLLNKELELYQPDLIRKPAILVLNKVENEKDKQIAEEVLDLVQQRPESLANMEKYMLPNENVTFDHVMTISAKKRIATEELKLKIREFLDIYNEQILIKEKQETMEIFDDVVKFQKTLQTHTTENKLRKLV
ncbi:GTP-binding protein 10-like [Octopus vulgaris]|uniref:GTP-binding protein 10-like n=1 Tax=Octopus vulgaris TaxID=6645 RepID=A0AA36B5T7_OCTVU|nr:GTP-binding protein 10-like [Octopus vulgaris]